MRVIMEFDIEVEGRAMTNEEIQDVFVRPKHRGKEDKFSMPGIILSEDVDGTDEWTININSWRVEVIE